jgi:hypothetical protein
MIECDSHLKTLYDSIIATARANPPIGYSERHHVIPRSLGGTDDSSNVVRLSARDHYECHKLLAEMFPLGTKERQKMAFALHKMTHGTNVDGYRITNEEYEKVRELNAQALSMLQIERFKDPEIRQRQVNLCLKNSLEYAHRVLTDPKFASRASENAKQVSKRLIDSGRHNFLSGVVQREVNNRPEIKEKRRQNNKRLVDLNEHLFQRPEFIEAQAERIRKHWQNMTPEQKAQRCAKISAGKKKADDKRKNGES